MLIVHVQIQITPESIVAFKEASVKNARASLQEAGILRFDVLQDRSLPTHFVLVEVYRDENAPLLHKQTSHYAEWRDTVAPMMAAPRMSAQYSSVFPDPASLGA
jgi:(4S)-4-hydroxy-5-phosphonooxypentane-2,3-dione isomerase